VSLLLSCVLYCQDNQKDLEHSTEQLSEYLERDITYDMLADIKQKVQDKYRSVHPYNLGQFICAISQSAVCLLDCI